MTEARAIPSVSVSVALDYLEEVETKLAELYAWLEERFVFDEDAWKLFNHVRHIEWSHANVVRFQKRLVMRDRGKFSNIDIDLYGVKRALALIEDIRGQDPPPDLNEVIGYLVELDKFACDRCYRNAITQANPGLATLMNNVTSDDMKIGKLVREFAKKRGIRV